MPGLLGPFYTKKQVDDLFSAFVNTSMELKGNWNANTNTPALSDGTGANGDVYKISTTGTRDLGSGSKTWTAGDFIYHNGTVWDVLIPSGGSLRAIVKFTANGTFTKANYPWLKYVRYRVVGGGGGGGGCANTGGSAGSAAAGGGAGGYSEGLVAASALAANETVTIGAAGAGAAAGANPGGAGGASAFGTFAAVGGGNGGGIGNANTAAMSYDSGQSPGGTATVGDILIPGGQGMGGWVSNSYPTSGKGGDSPFGTGGIEVYADFGFFGTGQVGTGRGSGGSGGCSAYAGGAKGGGAGTAGLVVLELYG